MNRWWRAALWGAMLAASLAAQDSIGEIKEDKEDQEKVSGARFKWKKHPSLRIGDWFRADFRYRVQLDWRAFGQDTQKEPELFDFARNRIGVEGTVTRWFAYEFSYDFAETSFHLKNFYGDFRPWTGLQARGGRFRIPFSMDQLTSPAYLDFIERSRIADSFAPNRDTGSIAQGELFGGGLKYAGGYFFNDGDNATNKPDERTGENAVLVRGTVMPTKFIRGPGVFKTLTLGLDGVTCRVPEAQGPFANGLRGKMVNNDTFFPRYWVKGRRNRIGTELSWTPGPFSLKGEYMSVTEQRLGQGLEGENLPDLIERGWYVSGTWVVTGQPKAKSLGKGRRIPVVNGGLGAVELAARAEAIRFASDGGAGALSRSLRASRVMPNSDRLWTWGVNWYPNQWVKVQSNFVRERIEDLFRSPIAGQTVFWTYAVRLQLQI